MESVFVNGGIIGSRLDYSSTSRYAGIVENIQFLDSNTTSNNNSVVIPATSQAGDIAIILDNINAAESTTAATGWTLIRSDSVSANITGTSYYKILQSGDAGSTVNSPNTSTTDHFMLCAVFRPLNGVTVSSVTIAGLQGQSSTAQIASQTLNNSLAPSTTASTGFFAMYQRGSNNAALSITTEPINDGFIGVNDESARSVLRLYHKTYSLGTARTDTLTANIADVGAQALQSWWINFTEGGLNLKNSGIWSLPAVYETLAARIPQMQFIASATADAATITIPATSQAGDFCLFVDLPARATSGTPIPSVTPTGVTGWTELSLYNTNPRNDLAIFTWGKILEAEDVGASVTASNYDTTAGFRRKTILIFRDTFGVFKQFSSALSLNNEGTSGDPAAQTVLASGTNPPVIVFGIYRGTQALSSPTFTPSADSNIDNGTTTRVSYKIFNTSLSNVTVDVGDVGDTTMLQSFYLRYST